MIVDGSYRGSNVIIQDIEGNTLAKTTVTEYNKKELTISVNGIFNNFDCEDHVIILILTNNGVHEYNGNIRKSIVGGGAATEIALFKGRVKENRKANRYAVDIVGTVENLLVNHKPAKLLHPLNIRVINFSSTGVLFSAKPNSFRNGAIAEMKLNMQGKNNILHGQIVRIKNIDSNFAEYGCKFISEGEE